MWLTSVLTFKRLLYELLSLRCGFDYSNLFCSCCMCVFNCWHSPWFFLLLFTWLSFVSCNLFMYGCSLSRTPLKVKSLVSQLWFVLANLNTIENSTSSFKDVQGSTIFWFLCLMIMTLVYWKRSSLASSPAYNVLLKRSRKFVVLYMPSLLVHAHLVMLCAFFPENTKALQCMFPSRSGMFLHSLSLCFAYSSMR